VWEDNIKRDLRQTAFSHCRHIIRYNLQDLTKRSFDRACRDVDTKWEGFGLFCRPDPRPSSVFSCTKLLDMRVAVIDVSHKNWASSAFVAFHSHRYLLTRERRTESGGCNGGTSCNLRVPSAAVPAQDTEDLFNWSLKRFTTSPPSEPFFYKM
jgi:hypothetical protein